MPTKDEHVLKAQGNEVFADSIEPTSQTRIDWKLIIIFYTAMHYVEAYLAKQLNIHGRSHKTRDNYIAREQNLRRIGIAYNHLKFYGYNARYELDGFTAKDVKDAADYLIEVKAILTPLL